MADDDLPFTIRDIMGLLPPGVPQILRDKILVLIDAHLTLPTQYPGICRAQRQDLIDAIREMFP